MKGFLKDLWQDIKDFFKTHEHCRICKKPLKSGGFFVPYAGGGFCKKHQQELLRHLNSLD